MSILNGTFHNTSVNTDDISRADLDISNKERSNPLSWKGQFSPQLIEVLIQKYAKPNDIIFDPFLGSGTVLLEAGYAKISAIGSEINPAAVILSKLYTLINMEYSERIITLQIAGELLQSRIFFESKFYDSELIINSIISLLNEDIDEIQSLLFENFLVQLDIGKADITKERISKIWSDICSLIIQLPYSKKQIDVINRDARDTNIPDKSIDLVITSPPYINVYNYHQQYRSSIEALNWDILKIAKSEIGANRKHRGNRFLTVIQYCLDLSGVFCEMLRICKNDARLIFIVGRQSQVLGTPFYNSEIVADLANAVFNIDLQLKQERMFKNRFGRKIYEDILHFSINDAYKNNDYLEVSREFAQCVLSKSMALVPKKSEQDLLEAINSVNLVQPSPIFRRNGDNL